MKRRNISKTILERGGLMIEALSMLGLIAIVTPTMYKKSAERTMEVEDINTASTIRTIMNAANDYVGANYSTIISDMGETQQTRPITADQLRQYLPYKFNVERALFNYGNPEITIVKQGNNLTTFALFPAQADIGQERTSRIASLVGASGGYVTENGKARGIGGIWKLEGDDYTNAFPTSGNGAQQYSIVTASADTINAATGNEIDMDKYLQRGKDASDDPNDRTTWWKNTMRTDLYMGNVDNANDVYNNNASTDTFSIRNIRSLIVGAENSGDDNDEYGLYIAEGGGKPNAFVGGSLSAAQQLFVGRDADSGDFHFNVDANGNTRADGSLTNLMDVNLANGLGMWNTVTIGSVDRHPARAEGDAAITIKSSVANSPYGKLTFFDDDVMYIQNKGNNDVEAPDGDRIVILKDGVTNLPNGAFVPNLSYNSEPTFPMRVGANAKFEGLVAAGQLDTQKIRAASLSIGSANIDDEAKWLTADKDGVIIQDIAGNKSTRAHFENNKITLGVGTGGSDNSLDNSSDDSVVNAGLVLKNEVDGDGNSTDSNAKLTANKVKVIGKKNVQVIGKDKLTASSKSALIQALNTTDFGTSEDFTNDLDENTLVLRNSNMQATMKDKQLTIEGRTSTDSDIKTVFNKGSVNLNDADFYIKAADNNDTSSSSRASIPSLSRPSRTVVSVNTTNSSDTHDIQMYGNILVGNSEAGKVSLRLNEKKYYASLGKYNTNAAINVVPRVTPGISSGSGGSIGTIPGKNTGIIGSKGLDLNPITPTPVTADENSQNIIYVDQGATYGSNNISNTDKGTIYIRKGYVEVRANNYDDSKILAADEGKGVIVASRFVANNPAATSGTVTHGAKFAEIPAQDFAGYNKSDTIAYDTYMVNPAYTSVMHDIKLTTRGGARLSDVLPDFINKGIYVVNNTISENTLSLNDLSDIEKKTYSQVKEYDKAKCDNKQESELVGSLDMGKRCSWASPLMGVVPAPQCPPGYGRVITLTPASFEMGQAGLLRKGEDSVYYITPNTASKEQAAEEADYAPSFERAEIEGGLTATGVTSDGKTVNVNISKGNTINGSLQTESYVLQYKTKVVPNTPLMFQQSTRLKTLVKELYNDSKDNVQGWAAIMGFLYPGKMYSGFSTSRANGDDKLYWNVFPVIRGTMEAYATVYCYFDRTNLFGGYDHYSDDFIDKYNYMKDMTGSPSRYKEDVSSSDYLERLNDPALKYNEVW